MVKGRRKPTRLKRLQGNPTRRPLKHAEPRPRNPLSPPDDLSDAVRFEWELLTSQAPAGLLTSLDVGAMRAYCEAMAAHRHAAHELARDGYIVPARRTGTPVQNPWWPIMNRAAGIMARLGDQLGLNPSGRAKIHGVALPTDDATDEYLRFIRRRDDDEKDDES